MEIKIFVFCLTALMLQRIRFLFEIANTSVNRILVAYFLSYMELLSGLPTEMIALKRKITGNQHT